MIVQGTDRAEVLTGTAPGYVIARDPLTGDSLGYAYQINGDDTISGAGGNDTIRGEGGTDVLQGDGGNDTLLGSLPRDRLIMNPVHLGFALVHDPGVETMHGGAGNDTLEGVGGADWLYGDAGDDQLSSNVPYPGDDESGPAHLFGGAGNDVIEVDRHSFAEGGEGNDAFLIFLADTVDGGDGDDSFELDTRAWYQPGFEPVALRLDGGPGVDTAIDHYVDLQGAFWVSVENAVASVARGDAGDNRLQGELVEGRLGNDLLVGVDGYPTGRATASYESAPAGVQVDLHIVGAQDTGAAGFDTLVSIANLLGSAFADVLTGDDSGNVLEGGAGRDTLRGGAGNDLYVVRDGDKTIVEADPNPKTGGVDTLQAYVSATLPANVEILDLRLGIGADGTGNDGDNLFLAPSLSTRIDGRGGFDTVSYAAIYAPVTADLGVDTLESVEALIGTQLDDTLRGDSGPNRLDGGRGRQLDTLAGGDGNDNYVVDHPREAVIETNADRASGGVDTVYVDVNYVLGPNIENARLLTQALIRLSGNDLDNVVYVGPAPSRIDGGGGADMVSYVFATSPVTVDLSITGPQPAGAWGQDTLSWVEGLTGSRYDDRLAGSAGEDTLNGGLGADTLLGGAGNDALDGGAGADRMVGGTGSDDYGVDDLLDLTIETDAAGSTGGYDRVSSSVSHVLQDNIESLRLLDGGAIDGSGNAGANTLFAGAGDNVIDGAGGIDTVSYLYARAGITASLGTAGAQATGGSGLDSLVNLESLVGSSYRDALGGDDGANVLDGGLSVDTLSGGGGNDNYFVDNTADQVIETDADPRTGGIDTVYSRVTWTLGPQVEHLRLLGSRTVDATGNGLDNVIYAGDGNNRIDGQGGIDTVSYVYAGAAVQADLDTGRVGGGSGNDVLSSIERLVGSPFDDLLAGNSAANVLQGGAGADTMSGGAGGDLYIVDNSADQIIEADADPATGGADLVYATASYTLGPNVENLRQTGAGAINATGNAANNILYAGAGNNTLDGAGGSDTVSYAYATAAVTANLSTGQATGGSGTDTLLNVEHLIGSGYADTLTGNTQANSLTGGTGADIFVLNSVLASDTISDFASGSDKVRISQAGIAIGNGDATVNNAATIAGPGGFATTAELVIISGNIAGALSTASAAAAIGSAGSAYGIGAKALFVVDNGSSSAAYLFTAADANAVVSAAELTLLTTLSNVPSTSAADWVFGA